MYDAFYGCEITILEKPAVFNAVQIISSSFSRSFNVIFLGLEEVLSAVPLQGKPTELNKALSCAETRLENHISEVFSRKCTDNVKTKHQIQKNYLPFSNLYVFQLLQCLLENLYPELTVQSTDNLTSTAFFL